VVQGVKECVIETRIQPFELHPDVVVSDDREGLRQAGYRFSIGQAALLHRLGVEFRNRPETRQSGIVVYDQDAVAGTVDVELDPVRAELYCPAKGSEAVLRVVAGRAPVGDH
jgi:hypothetical protein